MIRYKPILGEIRMRATAQLSRLKEDLNSLEVDMLSTMSSDTVLEWLHQNGSPIKFQLENLLNRIDYLYRCK